MCSWLTRHAFFGNKLDFEQQIRSNQNCYCPLSATAQSSCLRRHSNFAIFMHLSKEPITWFLTDVILICCKQLFVRNHESAMLSLSYQRIRTSSICSCDAGILRNGRRTRPQSFRSRPRDADQTWQCPSNSFPQANYPVLRSLAKTWTI